MPITYNPDTNTIIIVGTKNGSPYTFEDIYQADVDNGWGKFTKLSEKVYKTTAKLQFGDGSTDTLFEEKGTVLIIENTASKVNDVIVLFKAKCNAKFGEYTYIEDADDYEVKNGVMFFIRETNYNLPHFKIEYDSDVEFYGCSFYKTVDSVRHVQIRGYVKKFVGCVFSIDTNMVQNAEVRNCLYNGGLVAEYINSDIRGLTAVSYIGNLMWAGANPIEVRNGVFIVSDRLLDTRIKKGQINKFINCKSNRWVVRWLLYEDQESGETQRIYAVRFKVTDVNGNPLMSRIVRVYNRNGDLVAELQTDENGLTPEVEILYAKLVNPYNDGKWHTFYDEDWEYFNPFTIEVWYGSELEYKGILTDLDVDSTYIQITVKPSSVTLDDIISEIQAHRNAVEPKIDEPISTRASQTSVDDLATQITTHDTDIKTILGDIKGSGFDTSQHSLVKIKEGVDGVGASLSAHDSDIKTELSDIKGSGFDTSTDSLEKIRDKLDEVGSNTNDIKDKLKRHDAKMTAFKFI